MLADHYEDELEEELTAALSEDFNCDCEDGSPLQVLGLQDGRTSPLLGMIAPHAAVQLGAG